MVRLLRLDFLSGLAEVSLSFLDNLNWPFSLRQVQRVGREHLLRFHCAR